MSIEAKQYMLKTISSRLGDSLTVSDMNLVLDVVNDILSSYEIEALSDDQIDSDSTEYLKAFLAAKEIEGRSVKTIDHYRYVITRVMSGIGVPLKRITVFHLRRYLMHEKENGLADKTLEGIRSVLSSFFGWLQKEGLLKDNPCANLAPIKCNKKVRLPYSNIELERLKEACETTRDKAIILFLLSTGCRISEVCYLNRGDIDLDSHECTVFGKGGKERTVFLDDVTVMVVQRYLLERSDNCEALFIGKGTTRMTPGGIRARLKTIADRAGVNNVHPHRFRRTLATNLIKHGMQIQEVATILGHDKLDTTMEYVFINKTDIKTSYAKHI